MPAATMGTSVAAGTTSRVRQASAAGLGLDVRASERHTIQTDPVRVRQIVSNLLSNAGKYTPRGGITVTVETRTDRADPGGDSVGIRVSDTGPGVPPEKQELIFQEFMRLGPD